MVGHKINYTVNHCHHSYPKICELKLAVENFLEIITLGPTCSVPSVLHFFFIIMISTIHLMTLIYHTQSLNKLELDDISFGLLQEYKAFTSVFGHANSNTNDIENSKHSKSLISICHSEPGAWHAPYPNYETKRCPSSDSIYTIGRTMFETDRIPSGWIDRLNFMDEIWVPTEFSRKIFEENGVEKNKIKILGEPVDTIFFSPQNTDKIDYNKILGKNGDIDGETLKTIRNFEFLRKKLLSGTIIFLFVGKWEERKGIKLLLKAYYDTFSKGQNVFLVILTSAYHSGDNFEDQLKLFIKEEKIRKINNPNPIENENANKTKNNDENQTPEANESDNKGVEELDLENLEGKIYLENNGKKSVPMIYDTDPSYLILKSIGQKFLPTLYSLATALVSKFFVNKYY